MSKNSSKRTSANFVRNIELAIEASRHFRDEVLADVEAIRAAIDALPEERVIHVRVDYDNAVPEAAPVFGAGPTPGTASTAFDDILGEYEAMQARAGEAAGAGGAAWRRLPGMRLRRISPLPRLSGCSLTRRRRGGTRTCPRRWLRIFSRRPRRRLTAGSRSGGGGGGGGGWGIWGFLGRDVTMMAGLLPSIKGWHIALDGVLESAIALGSGLLALSAGIAAMVPPSIDIYNHLMAVQNVNAALKDQIPILGGGFRDVSEGAANASHVLEIYGGLVNVVSGQTGVFANVAKEVVAGFDDWVAKIDLFMEHESNTGKLLQDGVGFLHQFEQAVDNVAVALSHLLEADPGTAHYLMDIVVGATDVLKVVTELPAPILEAALALHSFWLWGGLMGTGIANPCWARCGRWRWAWAMSRRGHRARLPRRRKPAA